MGDPPSDDGAASEWSVRLATPEDRAAIHELWRDSFGAPGEDASEWLDVALGVAPARAWVATAEATPVGFVVAAAGGHRFARGYLDEPWVERALPERVAVIHMLGVDPAWRSTGVASALVRRCMDWASDLASVMLVVLWRRENHVDSSALAGKFGFERVRTIPDYYEKRTDCPDCGESCGCLATVHIKPLDDAPMPEIPDASGA